MQVFLSWSGERSKAVADLLDEWLQCVIQALDPWMSSKDIDRGSLWFSEISSQIQDTSIGVVCLTKENLNKPWILFESGALAKGLSSSRVCTLLIDLEPSDVSDPLAQFNHTLPDNNGIYELVRTLNNALGENGLKEKVLEQAFNTYWPQFENAFNEIIETTDEAVNVPDRTEESILLELLSTVRNLDKRMLRMESRKSVLSDNQFESSKNSFNAFADLLENAKKRNQKEGISFKTQSAKKSLHELLIAQKELEDKE